MDGGNLQEAAGRSLPLLSALCPFCGRLPRLLALVPDLPFSLNEGQPSKEVWGHLHGWSPVGLAWCPTTAPVLYIL
jgi:hypothetical protein